METKAEKIVRIEDFLKNRTLDLTKNIENWQQFLINSARFYKYSFTDQVLITSQRPDATMCASFNLWTGSLKRHIKQGSKGIPLLREKDGVKKLTYVYDVSDTETNNYSKRVSPWEMKDEYINVIKDRLGISNNVSYSSSLEDIIESRVDSLLDYTYGYALETIENKEGSFLEELDDLNIETTFTRLLKNSVMYTILNRCGIESDFNAADFRGVADFNTKEVITQLGQATAEISGIVLREIEKEVRAYEKEISQNKSRNLNLYDLYERENVTYEERNDKGNQRNAAHIQRRTENIPSSVHRGERSDIRTGQENNDIHSDVGTGGRRTLRNGNVGQEKTGVSENREKGNILSPDDKRSDKAPYRNGQSGKQYGGQADGRNEQSRRSNRGSQEVRSDGMGSSEKQHKEQGSGDNLQRVDIHLNNEQPKAEEKSSAFSNAVKTIETTLYSEPDENHRVKKIGNANAKDIFEQIRQHLEDNNLLPDDYFIPSINEYEELPDFYNFNCNVNFGESEGIYLDIGLLTENGIIPFATGKTLDESYESFIHMGRIAAECSLMLNGDGMLVNHRATKKEKAKEESVSTNDKAAETALSADKEAAQKEKNIIGNTPYRYIPKKTYRKFDKDTALKIAEAFNAAGIKYSGKINENDTTLTFSRNDIEKVEEIIKAENPTVDGIQEKNENPVDNTEESSTENSAPEITQEDIDGLLNVGSKELIINTFATLKTAKERADFLKKHNGIHGGSTSFNDGCNGIYSYNSKGLEITKYRKGEYGNNAVVHLSWSEIEKTIRKMIESGKFAIEPELNLSEYNEPEYEISDMVLNNMPDDTISIAERNEYGYTDNHLLPINKEKALEFYDEDIFSVYRLYEDETEGMAETRSDIEEFDGIFGIETEDWERYLENRETEKSEQENDTVNNYRQKTDMYFRPIQGYSAYEIEQIIKDRIADFVAENEIDIQIKDVIISGSRSRGIENDNSDLDIVLAYEGDYKEDMLFNVLNDEENNFDFIDGVKIDIDPIRPDESGTLESYLSNAEKYLQQKAESLTLSEQETENIPMTDEMEITDINLYRYGDFYEAFGQEAERAAEVLNLHIVNRDNSVMIGIPQHVLSKYTEILENEGYKVNTYEQTKESIEKNNALGTAELSDLPTSDIETDTEPTQDYNERISNKEKYRNNIEAIKTLYKIDNESREATAEEKAILKKYVGWGGLADVFDSSKTAWEKEYSELKELLAPSDYNAARSSTLNAHYTPPEIISSIYKALSNMGFREGKILEPSMGIGNFFAYLPQEMQQSKLYGVELDSITGRIAQKIYPNAYIQVKGFEKTNFNSNSFDVAVGNVPFGNYYVNDNEFKESDLIHDYFCKKSLDKIRPGGVMAFITTKGTLDKKNNSVRKYLAERADLMGAVRLPNNAFSTAGTEVTTDIIFLQKRDRLRDLTQEKVPEWVNVSENENGIEMNNYFISHPQMILGTMEEVSGRFGPETTCKPFKDTDLSVLLDSAVENIRGKIPINDVVVEVLDEEDNDLNIAAENYRNFCYAVIDNDIYYRENDKMVKQNFDGKKAERVKKMVAISEVLRDLISFQRDNYPDEEITKKQQELNKVYEDFVSEYGLLNDRLNKSVFREDDTAQLLLSLENINEKTGELESKADIFTKRTIIPYIPVESVDTSSEALAVSIAERAKVDLDFMAHLCSKPVDEVIKDLEGVIFENPVTNKYETAEEYLSGNVRHKLELAKQYAEKDTKYAVNVNALENVQPEDLQPSEITAQLGSTWIPTHYYQEFMYELLDTPYYCRGNCSWRDTDRNPFRSGAGSDNETIIIDYDEYNCAYGISNKSNYSASKNNIKASKTYGTDRMNAYKILEETLNMKTVKVMDYVENFEGKKVAVLNEKETLLAQEKQNAIKNKFKEWLFDDYERTQDLCKIYNEKFNSVRPREYDGSHITFGGINHEIKLRKHQIDAIAHTLYGGNTLLAHSVGAGKTFEMVASAMESKRLGLCSKSMIVVPKHILNQVAKEFLQLYPAANILVPNEKDFSKDNRERFCSRIATGNYDAIIISHNQFEKIPLSTERQVKFIEEEIEEITNFIEALRFKEGNKGFTVKQLETTKKNLETRLEKLNNADRRDTTITFEEMGIDKLYIDEAHMYKNLYFNTKMGRNVAGINASSASQRATDLLQKCRYLDEKTDSKGIVFATGTPISNSMTELYVMQSYLQHDELKRRNLNHFDAWASTFGETQLSLELAPEGKGYQMKTRFAKFFNLPELMSMFKEIADIKTADVLNLPVPKANHHTVVTDASEYQKEMVDGLAERANNIRKRIVSSDVDNMLNVTNDGRKLALDQRLANPLLPDDENSKVNACMNNVYEVWKNTADKKGTQMIFCDLSTPHFDGTFNVYDDIKEKLINKGVPENEIAYIHDCKTDEQKLSLFTKVRNGEVRILLGSTGKMGTGANCQDKLTALHHLDCPWKPSDLEQRNGRIIRQGNENSEADIYNYVTKGTFDSYLYQLVENKQRFISQIMTSKSPARSAEDIDETVLSYAQIKALAAGNPKIKEKMDLDIEVNRLRTVFAGYQENKRTLQQNIAQTYPSQIQKLNNDISGLTKDMALAENNKTEEFNGMTVGEKTYTDKKEAGTAFLESVRSIRPGQDSKYIGEYRGFHMSASFNTFTKNFEVTLKSNMSYVIDVGQDVFGNITRIENAINGIPKKLEQSKTKLNDIEHSLAVAKEEVNKPFPQLDELREKEARLNKLNEELATDNVEDTSKVDKEHSKDHSATL